MESEKGSCLVLIVQCCLFLRLLFLSFLSLDANSRSNICPCKQLVSKMPKREFHSQMHRCTGVNLFLSHHFMFFYNFGLLGVFLQGVTAGLTELDMTSSCVFSAELSAKIDLIKHPSVGR